MTSTIQERLATIKTRHAQEVQQQAIPREPQDIPISYELISDEWLTKVICKDVAGAEVIEHTLDKPDEGVTNRRRIFVKYNAAGKSANLPGSLFCKATQTLESRFMLGLNHGIEGEVKFFNQIRQQLDIEAPRAILANADSQSQNSIVMMPDMSDEVTFCSHTTPITSEQAKNQVKLLAKLHGRFYQSPELETTLGSYHTMEDFYNTTSQVFDFIDAAARGFTAARDVIPAKLFDRAEEVTAVTARSYLIHGELPRTFIHNDTHLKNWYITKNNHMGLNDWQTACKGHWSRDLAYTLATSLTIENRRAWENQLLELYREQFATVSGVNLSPDEIRLRYRQQMISALSMWTVTFAPKENSPDMQPEDTCIEFINRISTAVDDLESVESLS